MQKNSVEYIQSVLPTAQDGVIRKFLGKFVLKSSTSTEDRDALRRPEEAPCLCRDLLEEAAHPPPRRADEPPRLGLDRFDPRRPDELWRWLRPDLPPPAPDRGRLQLILGCRWQPERRARRQRLQRLQVDAHWQHGL